MNAILEVMDGGLSVTVQDMGRAGYRNIGVPLSGALDPHYLAAANALLGNAPDAAALEVVMTGPSFRLFSGSSRIALAGNISARLMSSQGSVQTVKPWTTATLLRGDILQLGTVAGGIAYVGVSGGFLVPSVLGSRSTYQRARLGGVQGRAIAAGDRLPCGEVQGDPWLECCSGRPLRNKQEQEAPIRVILGPQEDHFTADAIEAFLGQAYSVTRDMDRMGMRLDGPLLKHNRLGADIVSDGVAPGSIQVPANGHPIVLLADCQTSGGYPKIATVIQADLVRLGHARPGTVLRFQSVTMQDAVLARQQQADQLDRWIANLTSFRPPGLVNEQALYESNLVSGLLRGDEPALHDTSTLIT